MAITVGVVCFNEESHISTLLESLTQDSNRRLIENMIVIDNGSTDQTLEIVQQFSKRLPIQWFKNTKNSVGLARQLVVKKCTTPLVTFVDADCVVPPNWLSQLKDGFEREENGKLAGVCGPNRLPEDQPWKVHTNRWLNSPLGHGGSPQAKIPKSSEPTSHLPTTNALYQVDAIRAVGGFKDLSSGEDSELGARLKAAGYQMHLLPQPIVINDSAQNIWDWGRRMFRFGTCHWLHSPITALFTITMVLWCFYDKDIYKLILHTFLIYLAAVAVFTKSPKTTALAAWTILSYGAGICLSPIRHLKN